MPHLKGSNVTLRPSIPEDAPLFVQWLNDLDVALPLGDEAYEVITEDNVYAAIQSYPKDGWLMYTIITKDDTPIGRCVLFGIDHINDRAMIGIFIGERSAWGQGYAKEAMELLIDYGFAMLNLHSISLGVFAFNQRAQALYKKLGFKQYGIRRQARKIHNQYHDVIFMDLLADEWTLQHLHVPE